MKKHLMIMACLATVVGLQAHNDVKILPAKAQKFIEDVFPTHGIRYIEAERDLEDPLTYEVHFADGSEVEFDKGGNWYKIDCGKSPVPLKAIPQGIQDYIAKVAPDGSFVVEIERTRGGYEVELNNDRDYRLTEKGEPIKIHHMMGQRPNGQGQGQRPTGGRPAPQGR